MKIMIHIDPTELDGGTGIAIFCDDDYAGYVSAVEVITALGRLSQTLEKQISKVIMKDRTSPPEMGPDFMEKCKAVTLKQISDHDDPNDMDLLKKLFDLKT